MAPTSAYLIMSLWLLQLTTRQLLSYQMSPDNAVKIRPAADLAREVPTRENGGISADGRIYTIHLRRGPRWNSSPARPVVAGDAVRGIKLLCNPAAPAGALNFLANSLKGMQAFSAAFAHVPVNIDAFRRFVNSTSLDGVREIDDSTVRFELIAPHPDFPNILAMPAASPVPVETLDYLPDSPEYRQNTIANGAYRMRIAGPGTRGRSGDRRPGPHDHHGNHRAVGDTGGRGESRGGRGTGTARSPRASGVIGR
jgi:ABC-type transport system substrate-binding protein